MAPVVLQIIDAPSGVLDAILILVTEASGASGAGFRPSIGIDSEFQTQRMDVVADSFHAVRKMLGIPDDVPAGIATHLPAVVNIDVNVSGIFHARLHNRVRHALDQVFADVTGELVPRVPTHGGSEREVG